MYLCDKDDLATTKKFSKSEASAYLMSRGKTPFQEKQKEAMREANGVPSRRRKRKG
jgi:hypothetical protein